MRDNGFEALIFGQRHLLAAGARLVAIAGAIFAVGYWYFETAATLNCEGTVASDSRLRQDGTSGLPARKGTVSKAVPMASHTEGLSWRPTV